MRRILLAFAGFALVQFASPEAAAQAYPSKPVRLIVPWAPAGTPRPIIEFLNAEVLRILSFADVRERFAGLGAEPMPSVPEKFGAVMAADAEKWGRVIKQVGVRAD